MPYDLSPFGFRTTPFTRELAVTDRFPLPHQDQVVQDLTHVVQQRQSAALIAPAGTGKTVVLRLLRAALPEARYQLRYVKVTGLSQRDLCKELAEACGLPPAGIFPALVRKLQQAFTATTDHDSLRPVLLMDEAHDLRPEALALLRLLTNFDMDSRLVVAVILAGQPPLRTLLTRPDQVAIAQRLVHYATLPLLTRDQTHAYLVHRCAIAGALEDPFAGDAHEALFEISHGNLRALDHLALKALLLATQAQARPVTTVHVIAARQQLSP